MQVVTLLILTNWYD